MSVWLSVKSAIGNKVGENQENKQKNEKEYKLE